MTPFSDPELKSSKPSKTTSTKVVIMDNKEKFANLGVSDLPIDPQPSLREISSGEKLEMEPVLDMPTLKKKCKTLWEELSDDIFDLNKLGLESAKDWQNELRDVDLDKIGDEIQGLREAWKTLNGLKKTVAIAKPYAQYHTERASVDKNIKWLQAQHAKSAGTLASVLLKVDETAKTNVPKALMDLKELRKNVAAAGWQVLQEKKDDIEKKIEKLKSEGLDLGIAESNWQKAQLLALTDPLQAVESAKLALEMVSNTEKETSEESKEFKKRRSESAEEVERILKRIKDKSYGATPEQPLADYLTGFSQCEKNVVACEEQPVVEKDYTASLLVLDKLDAALKNVQSAEAIKGDELLNKLKVVTDKSLLRKAIIEADSHYLKLAASTQQGGKMLDDLVADIGSTASKDESRKVLTAAIQARFGLELKGDSLDKKSLPQLYKVLKLVPLSHTAGNLCLKVLQQNAAGDFSWYKSGELVLNTGRPGKSKETFYQEQGWLAKSSVDDFDATTLHEVAHAVDDAQKYMDKFGNTLNHGEWNAETLDTVVAAIASDAKFGDFNNKFGSKYPPKFLKSYLLAALQGKSALAEAVAGADSTALNDDEAVKEAAKHVIHMRDLTKGLKRDEEETWPAAQKKQFVKDKKKFMSTSMKKTKAKKEQRALIQEIVEELLYGNGNAVTDVLAKYKVPDATGTEDLAKLAKHEAVAWCDAVRLKGGSGLWREGKSGAEKYALSDGRVYQQSYSKNWCSYDVSARGDGVTKYQFRAPGEWFAEAYSAFFLGKLKASHALHAFLTKEKQAG